MLRKKPVKRSLQSEAKTIPDQAATPDAATVKTMALKFGRQFKGRKFTDTVKLIRKDRDR